MKSWNPYNNPNTVKECTIIILTLQLNKLRL